jgi:hypothetical protein
MKTRKKYSVLNPVQKTLAEGSTAILDNGAIVRDITRLSTNGRYWVGVIVEGVVGHRADGQATKFTAETVVEVADLPAPESEVADTPAPKAKPMAREKKGKKAKA